MAWSPRCVLNGSGRCRCPWSALIGSRALVSGAEGERVLWEVRQHQQISQTLLYCLEQTRNSKIKASVLPMQHRCS
ncbi:uncharacterized protein [Vicugna pacos]|uniref:Uncharacterized protein isoform X3 n=1 Tax=Vicugna pacos TaxID=30538 RepID=A0ABM5CRB9_VICPA